MSRRPIARTLTWACAMAAILAFALGTVACVPAAPTDSGVRGTVRIGPTTPVQRVGEPSDAPYQADLVVSDFAGTVAARTRSAADGGFSVNLAPGAYTIQGAAGSMPPTPQAPQSFTVRAHEFTTVTIAYDTGIR